MLSDRPSFNLQLHLDSASTGGWCDSDPSYRYSPGSILNFLVVRSSWLVLSIVHFP